MVLRPYKRAAVELRKGESGSRAPALQMKRAKSQWFALTRAAMLHMLHA
jgi:hypothetical protein